MLLIFERWAPSVFSSEESQSRCCAEVKNKRQTDAETLRDEGQLPRQLAIGLSRSVESEGCGIEQAD
jgi:hypothetical protein